MVVAEEAVVKLENFGPGQVKVGGSWRAFLIHRQALPANAYTDLMVMNISRSFPTSLLSPFGYDQQTLFCIKLS